MFRTRTLTRHRIHGSVDQLKRLIYQTVFSNNASKTWWTSLSDMFRSVLHSARSLPIHKIQKPAIIVVSGLDGAGKSSLLQHLARQCGRDVETHILFIGAALEVMRHGSVCFLSFDVGGGRPHGIFRLETACYQICDAVVFVVDSADHERMVEAREELCRAWNGFGGDAGLRGGAPVLLLANKQHEMVCGLFFWFDWNC